MVEYLERIKELEEELQKTSYNKRTQHHIGLIKAKIAKLREKEELRGSAKGGKPGYDVRKTGDASAIMIGYPSVGKSTLLNALTNAQSKVGSYDFTTLTVIPGLMGYNGAKIQILDVPGVIKGASIGKGRGKEVLSVMRGTNLVIILIEINYPEHLNILKKEIFNTGIRLDQKKPDVKIKKAAKGGIRIGTTVKLKKIDKKTIEVILNEFKYNNADVLIREDIDADQLIDCIEGNKIYVPSIIALNKVDSVSKDKADEVAKQIKADILISAEKGLNIDPLKRIIFNKLNFIRVYMKEPAKKADLIAPLIMFNGCTIKDVCNRLHKDFVTKFKFARVWGSSKFPGQKLLRLEYVLRDKDVLELHLR